MDQRRILLLLGGLLLALALVASVTPRPEPPLRPLPPPAAGSPARTVAATLRATDARPATVRAAPGDIVRLTVSATRPDLVLIPRLDRVEPVERATPAVIEFVPRRAERLVVRLRDADRVVGRVDVRARD